MSNEDDERLTSYPDEVREARAAVEEWNRTHGPAVPAVRIDDLGRAHLTRTRSEAWVVGGEALILIEGMSGGYALHRVHAIEPDEGSVPLVDVGQGLTFSALRGANVTRCEAHYHRVDAWSLMDWLGAVTGELGEAAHIIKDIRRAAVEPRDNGHRINSNRRDLGEELADVVIYLDLLAERAGIDLGGAVVAKFNAVSRGRLGSDVLLPEGGAS